MTKTEVLSVPGVGIVVLEGTFAEAACVCHEGEFTDTFMRVYHDGVTAGLGYALLHPNDDFDAEKGVRIALDRALRGGGPGGVDYFNKAERTAIWDAVNFRINMSKLEALRG